ncbi:MAG: TetR/AcrR family transcriptional regulator [Bacteroidetes bacterium]|nr:MAG: TetR/AcrR family transcriptional regulator [Bacteroidota bacterium]
MAIRIRMELNNKLFLRDPQDTKLGRNIIRYSILLIDEIGFEQFTFKKLAERMGSTEASVYRYFENKHILLVYLLCWYWEWMKFQIEYNSNNVEDPCEKLRQAIATIVNTAKRNATFEFVDEDILHRVVVAEGDKGYHTKEVDKENREGYFATYKSLSERIAGFISEINPTFAYPRALATTLLEMAKDHTYFAQHLPRLTDVKVEDGNLKEVEQLLLDFAFGLVKPERVSY